MGINLLELPLCDIDRLCIPMLYTEPRGFMALYTGIDEAIVFLFCTIRSNP